MSSVDSSEPEHQPSQFMRSSNTFMIPPLCFFVGDRADESDKAIIAGLLSRGALVELKGSDAVPAYSLYDIKLWNTGQLAFPKEYLLQRNESGFFRRHGQVLPMSHSTVRSTRTLHARGCKSHGSRGNFLSVACFGVLPMFLLLSCREV